MAWQQQGSSDRKARLPSNWDALRALVMARCGGRCEVVKANGKRCWDNATDVDHIVAGDDHSPENLRGICKWHHARKSSREGVEARAAKRSVLRRPPEIHPGIYAVKQPPPPNRGF